MYTYVHLKTCVWLIDKLTKKYIYNNYKNCEVVHIRNLKQFYNTCNFGK